MSTVTKSKEYSILAEVYDEVMRAVDYKAWADFINEVIQMHHSHPDDVLELACGTGSLTLELAKFGYQITASDKSPEMVEKAREKAANLENVIEFKRIDFLDIQENNTYNVIVCVFDSINYLQQESDLLKMFAQVRKVMKKDSLFVFDFTTPRNSLESTKFLDNRNGSTQNGFYFYRKSHYDADSQIHSNTFEIEKRTDNGETVLKSFTEEHRQRTYTVRRMKNIISKTDFVVEAAYAEFDLIEADENSSRITMVLQLNTQDY